MREKLFTAVTAAALVVFAAAVAAKPVNYLGAGCLVRTYMDPAAAYSQTFKPTFSVLRQVRFVLFEVPPADGDVTFLVHLRDGNGILATSNGGVLSAGTTYEDAAAGEFVTFTFEGGAVVTPGQSYRLELVRVSGDAPVWICLVSDWPDGGYHDGYPDGYFIVDENVQAGYDMEFALKGSGPPK